MLRRAVVLVVGGAWLGACTANLDRVAPGATGGASVGTGGTPGGGTPALTGGSNGAGAGPGSCARPEQVSAPVLHARLITPSQYEHTAQDLLKVTGNFAKDFAGGASAHLDDVALEQRANTAADIAAKAVATFSAWSPCVPPAVDASTCESKLIDQLGRGAFRHPLAADEQAQLKALFDAGIKEKDFATGVEWLLTGLLQAPDFLYEFAKPQAGEVPGSVVSLPAFEIASRLALFIWDGPPDEALLGAAEAGSLKDATGVLAQAQKLMADPRSARGTESFYRGWLKLDAFKEVARDDAALTTDVVVALQRSLLLSATSLYAADAPNVESLFTGETYYLDASLRAFYGLTGGSSSFDPVAMPAQGRRGVLTHPGLMTLLARPNESNPISRGLFVQRTVLCHDIPPPPQGVVIPQLAKAAPGLPTRLRLEQHTKEAVCAGCHDLIDPPGFALESYDMVGRYRTMDEGVAVDTSGVIAGTSDTSGAFTVGTELLDRIAKSSEVKRCFAQKYLTHAIARELAPEDSCALEQLQSEFASSGDLKRLILNVAHSDAFRLRTAEGRGAQP